MELEWAATLLSHWSGQQQHLLQWLQALGAQEMQWAQALEKGPWLQMYMVPGNCTPFGWWTTEGSPGQTWQAWGGSFLLLPRRDALSSRWLWTFNHNVWKPPGRSSRSCYQSSLHATSLSKHVVVCTALVCSAQCSMPARLGHWQSRTSSICSEMTGQWSDRSAMSGHKTLSPPGLPASVAQLDAPSDWRPGGRGFNPRRGRQHSFVAIDHEIFSTVILSLPLIQEGQLSVSGERMCTILVNRLED